jgi:hypothetical protein
MTAATVEAPAALHRLDSAEARVARLRERLGSDATAITMSLLAELDVYDTALDVLYPWVRDRVRHELRRLEVEALKRRQREQVRAKRGRAHGRAVVKRQSVETPRELAFLDFKIMMAGAPNGWKLYRHLTPQEHNARRIMHLKNATPLLASARGYEWAAETCLRHKVLCLDEVNPDVLIQELPKEGIRPLVQPAS